MENEHQIKKQSWTTVKSVLAILGLATATLGIGDIILLSQDSKDNLVKAIPECVGVSTSWNDLSTFSQSLESSSQDSIDKLLSDPTFRDKLLCRNVVYKNIDQAGIGDNGWRVGLDATIFVVGALEVIVAIPRRK